MSSLELIFVKALVRWLQQKAIASPSIELQDIYQDAADALLDVLDIWE